MRAIVLVLLLAACGAPAVTTDCDDGETRACYQGRAVTRGVGTCQDGLEQCTNGRWSGICLGDVVPVGERCDGADEDCNGVVDDVATTGVACLRDGCAGERACQGSVIACVAPEPNACGVCDGPEIPDLGTACSNGSCPGFFVCASGGDAAICDAPAINACELCGGPGIVGLGDPCAGPSGCDGELVCNPAGTGTTCSCNPQPGQCKDAGVPRPVIAPMVGDLVITEVMPSPAAVSDTLGEWFEVRVLRDVDLNELELDRAGDALAPILVASATCLRVTAGSHLVFARSADPAVNGGLPPVTHRFDFSLITGSPTTPGDVRLLREGVLLDAITWTGSATGKARQLDPDLTDPVANDTPSNFCDATAPYGTTAADLGTPGAENGQCTLLPPPGSCDDAGVIRPIVKPAAGALVITELLANPAGASDAVREWLELANTSGAAFDLNELVIGRASGTGTVVQVARCVPVAAGGFALLARSNDPAQNGGLPPVDATFGFALVDSAGDVEVREGATVLDAITWPSVASGVARQLDPAAFTTTANDLGTSFCAGTTPYGDGTNLGTPRAANLPCP